MSDVRDLPLVFDRIDKRTFTTTSNQKGRPFFIGLGWSWLPRYEDYLGKDLREEGLKRIFTRPGWPFQPTDDTFVLISPLVPSALLYLSGCTAVWRDAGWDNEVRMRSCIAAQLQEVDFYLSNR
jgi:hypothetical protein